MLAREVWFCGDVHGSLKTLVRALDHADPLPKAVLLLGDLDPPVPIGEWLAPVQARVPHVWFIHGNHETDSDACFKYAFQSQGAELNLHATVRNLDGLRIAGLGGVFRSEIWYPPALPHFRDYEEMHAHWLARTPRHQRQPLADLEDLSGPSVFSQRMRKHRSSIFPDAFEALSALNADVLVVHEAPSCHAHGFAAIDELAQMMGVRLVVHGHHHDALDYEGSKDVLGFQALGVGLRGISTGDGRRIVAGELDEHYRRMRQSTQTDTPQAEITGS